MFYAFIHMKIYPKKRGKVYTDQMNLKLEPELKSELKELNQLLDEDIHEAIRIEIRSLAIRLREKANREAS